MKLIREAYLQKIRPYYEVDLIKVITGVRRAGKSILLETIRDELVAKGVAHNHIIYINLEDLDYEYIVSANELHREIKSRVIDEAKYYIFLDEVQHVKNFEKALASFRATLNASIFVTGSNSTLLSGELASLLTGRTVEFEVFPFSFAEVRAYKELNGEPYSDDDIYDYLKWGGLPLRFNFHSEADIRLYITNLYNSIIIKDIIKKSRNINKENFRAISLYILANAGKEFSAASIAKYFANNNKVIAERTIYNYLDKMRKSYLLHTVQKYNLAGKEALKNKEKFYAIDTGFRTINTNSINFQDTFFLENIIYNELCVQGFTVYVGKTYKGEIDFIAIKDGKKCFIQVAYLLATPDTIAREFGAFKPISDASPKYVLSLDRMDFSQNGITHINIVDFLLHRRNLELS